MKNIEKPKEKPMEQRFWVRFVGEDQDLKRQFKVVCAQLNVHMNTTIIGLMQDFVNKHNKD